MNKSNAWAWSLMLIATLFFGVGLGLSLGHAIWAPKLARVAETPPNESDEPPRSSPEPAGPATSVGTPRVKTPRATAGTPGEYWAARHLFVTVNGQWLADATAGMLKDLRPGGVLLTESNLGSRAQTFALVREIKKAAGIGDGLGDLPLIAAQQEGGPYNQLAVENAPSAQAVAQSGDPELARKLGREYAEACVGRGIAVAFAPVLDVFEVGAINPGFAARSFGTDQSVVTTFGLAMADGLRQGGVLPVVKHFPGFGAATYGADGLLVVLNKDYGGLARVMYPFNEAVRYGVPGMLVAHVAVPALDPDEPRRSAALSPVLVNDLLRERWGFEGVIIADDVAMNSMTRSIGAEAAAVQALAAGCDAVLILDPDPGRIRAVATAIAKAVQDGRLSREKLEQSVARLERWQDAIGNLNPLDTQTQPTTELARQVRELPPPPRTIQGESPPPAPEQLAAANPQVNAPAPDVSTTPASASESPAQRIPTAAPTSTGATTAPQAAESSAAAPPRSAPAETQAPVETETDPEWKQAATSEPTSQKVPETSQPTPSEPTQVVSATPHAQPEPSKPEPELETAEVAAKLESSVEPPASVTVGAGNEAPTTTKPESQQPAPSPAESSPESQSKPEMPEPDETPVETQVAKLDTPPPATPGPQSAPKSEPAPRAAEPKPTSSVTEQEAERSTVVHTVKEGELLSAIAALYSVAVVDLVRWNRLETAQVSPGTDLTVYLPETDATKAEGETKPAAPPPAENPDIVVPAGKLVHTVVEGDTLSAVAEKYGVNMADLALWNGLQDAALEPGQLLTIFLDAESAPNAVKTVAPPRPEPTAAGSAATASSDTDGGPVHYSPKSATIDYVIKPGDTLRKIAREHGTTVDTLLGLNNLEDANQILVGNKLKVPAP